MAETVELTECRLKMAQTFTFTCGLDLADPRSMIHWIAHHPKHTFKASDHEYTQSRTYDMAESVELTDYRSKWH